MNKLDIKTMAVAAACCAAISGCVGGNEWRVNGQIEDAGGQTIVLEASRNGRWFAIDSAKLTGSGEFKFAHKAAGYPDIYRLRLGDKSLYFPIDSIENVTVVSNAGAFDTDYSLSGSESAEMLMHVDRRIREAVAKNGVSSLPKDSLLKRELGGMMLGDPAGIVSYYIINKKVGGVALFNPADKSDNRVIGAVANAFDQFRPNDPRTDYLRQLFLSNRRVSSSATLEAPEVSLLEIELYDDKGALQSLGRAAEDNKVVVLSFTVYGSDASAAYNVELNKIYDRYASKGLQIYQVSLDDDEYRWKQSARNLPWITVFNSKTDGVKHLNNYNVQSLPTTFIIAGGEIAERVSDPAELSSAVAKRL